MKYVCVLLLLVPLVFGAPSDRFILDTFGLDKVVQTVEQFAHSGMAHDACVAECQNLLHGFLNSFCDTACTTALAAIPEASYAQSTLYPW